MAIFSIYPPITIYYDSIGKICFPLRELVFCFRFVGWTPICIYEYYIFAYEDGIIILVAFP